MQTSPQPSRKRNAPVTGSRGKVLLALSSYLRAHQHSPTFDELGLALGITRNSVWQVVRSLRAMGLMEEVEKATVRGLKLTPKGRAVVRNLRKETAHV